MPPTDAIGVHPPRATVSRRRFLTIVAGVGGLSAVLGMNGALQARADAPATDGLYRWQGTALGARARLYIHHPDSREARRLTGLALAEIDRLEKIFSLYRADSSLVALNRSGRLDGPPLDLVVLLDRARNWSDRTGGAFDVTLQPLWVLYRRHFAADDPDPRGPAPAEIAAAKSLVDYRDLEIGSHRLRLGRRGMAVTLNGIAQGYITDRVADLLRAEGLEQVIVDLGEIQALGNHPEGRPWRVGLDQGKTLEVVDAAVATSARQGTSFDAAGVFSHLLDPRNGRPSQGIQAATVVAEEACDADALSTALLIAQPSSIDVGDFAQMGIHRVLIVDPDGRRQQLL